MSEIPTISVTGHYQSDVSEGEMSDCDMKDVLTDVEDLNDGVKEKTSLKVHSKARKSKSSPVATDIEDYVDSSDDQEEKIRANDDMPLSLTEFLEHGTVETNNAAADKTTTTTTQRSGALFAPLINDDQGGVTDCENYNSSGDELSIADDADEISISAFLIESENVQILDKICQKASSDSEDAESELSVSEAGDVCNPYELSDAEDLALSDVEDNAMYQKLCAEVSVISNRKEDVEDQEKTDFMATTLIIPEIQEDNITDTEGIEMDSDAEILENGSTRNLQITTNYQSSHRHSLTDVEDIDIGDASDFLTDPPPVSASDIPAAVREITIVKADVSGQRVTNTMPLQGNPNTGIDTFLDKGVTDVEDLSDDEDYYEYSNSRTIDHIPEPYIDMARNVEIIKDTTASLGISTEAEPTTDIEEIFMAGTVRRKKTGKSKSQMKSKKTLQTKSQEQYQDVTDIEELDVSDAEAAKKSMNSLQIPCIPATGKQTPEIKTDVEYVSGDDEQYISEGEERNEQVVKAINATSFCSTETTIESVYQSGSPYKRKETKEIRRTTFEISEHTSNQNLTDVEDINLHSDVEDTQTFLVSSYSRAATVSPSELQDALNESSVSIVHDKCGSAFDMNKERHYIKGLGDCVDAHTDVEYIEDENEPGKEQNAP